MSLHGNNLLRTETTDDAIPIIEVNVPAKWDGPPLHHHTLDEAFHEFVTSARASC